MVWTTTLTKIYMRSHCIKCGDTKTQSRYNRNRLYLLFFLPKRPILEGFGGFIKLNAFQNNEKHQNSADTTLGKDCAAEKIIVKTITRLHKTFVFPYFLR